MSMVGNADTCLTAAFPNHWVWSFQNLCQISFLYYWSWIIFHSLLAISVSYFANCIRQLCFCCKEEKIWLTMMETNRVYFTSLQKLILSVDSAARNVNDKVSANLMASHSWWQDGCPRPSISSLFKAGQKEEQGSHICSFQEPSTWRLLFMPHWPELWHMGTPATKEAGKDDLFFSTSIMEVDNSHNVVICTSSL